MLNIYFILVYLFIFLNLIFFYRKEMGGDLAHVALAVQGAPAGSPQSLALAVAAKGIYFI